MIAASPLLSLLACGPGVSLSGVDPHPTYLYAFELTGDFSTSARGPGGQPLPEAEGLPDRQLRLRGEVEIHYARGFRDGSEGHLVRFHEVQRAEGEGPWEESSLGGRSVELRVFDGGEILDAYELEHISGPGRDGDLFDLLLPTLSPVVPRMPKGEEAWLRASWPFGVGKTRQLRTMLNAEYRNEEILNLPQGRSVRLSYAGTLEGRGRESEGPASLSLAGEASGEVFMRISDAQMVQHDFEWTRTLDAEFEGSGAVLSQVRAARGHFSLKEER